MLAFVDPDERMVILAEQAHKVGRSNNVVLRRQKPTAPEHDLTCLTMPSRPATCGDGCDDALMRSAAGPLRAGAPRHQSGRSRPNENPLQGRLWAV